MRYTQHAHLISPQTIEPIQRLKLEVLGNSNRGCIRTKALVALSISASMSDVAAKAFEKLPDAAGAVKLIQL